MFVYLDNWSLKIWETLALMPYEMNILSWYRDMKYYVQNCYLQLETAITCETSSHAVRMRNLDLRSEFWPPLQLKTAYSYESLILRHQETKIFAYWLWDLTFQYEIFQWDEMIQSGYLPPLQLETAITCGILACGPLETKLIASEILRR